MRLLAFFIFTFISTATSSSAVDLQSGETNYGTVIVHTIGYKNNKGFTRCQLWEDTKAKAFPTKTDSAFKRIVVHNDSLQSTAVFSRLHYGWYAVTVHQDEDGDTWMNKNWLGMPAEPYGLSNNPKILFSVPDFDECKFKIDKDTVEITIKLKNT